MKCSRCGDEVGAKGVRLTSTVAMAVPGEPPPAEFVGFECFVDGDLNGRMPTVSGKPVSQCILDDRTIGNPLETDGK